MTKRDISSTEDRRFQAKGLGGTAGGATAFSRLSVASSVIATIYRSDFSGSTQSWAECVVSWLNSFL